MAVASKLSRLPTGKSLGGYSAVSAIADLVTIPRNSGQLYENALNKVLEVLELRHGNLRLLNPSTGALDLMACHHPEPFTFNYIQDTWMGFLGDEIKRKQLQMDWEIDPRLPHLFTDQEKIAKVFRNLVDNAVKFTDQGRITVRVRFLSEKQLVHCEVEDTGIGIPSDQFQVIFDPFHQIDSSHTRLYGGMGLGLRNAKRTLELLGGGIEVESTVRKGSLFRFWFPAHRGGRG